jgi:hypothetical protein
LGLAEYVENRALVSQGFLMPMFISQIKSTDETKLNWEHSSQAWCHEFANAGFTDVNVIHVADYWWAESFMLKASGLPRGTAAAK